LRSSIERPVPVLKFPFFSPRGPPGLTHRAADTACGHVWPLMPISDFLSDLTFDPEARRIMGLAFEMARIALGLVDRGDLINEMIAKKIIELAKAGERNPDVLCDAVLKLSHAHPRP